MIRTHATFRWLLAPLLVVLVAGLPPALDAAGSKAIDILKKAVLARDQVTYSAEATVTFGEFGRGPRTLQETRWCKKGGKQRVQVKGPGGELFVLRVTDGSTQWEYFPKRASVSRRQVPALAERHARDLENLQLIARNFKTTLLGVETVAGRTAYRIRIDRRTQPPVIVRQYWIDSRTYLELKSEHYMAPGPPAGSVTLTRVNYAPVFSPGMFTFEPPPNVTVRTAGDSGFRGTLAAAQKKAGFPAILPKKVPTGFVLLDDSVAVMTRHDQTSLWLRYSNGIDSFSLFQRQAGGPREPRAPGSVRQWEYKGYQFTLVGWLLPADAELIQGNYR